MINAILKPKEQGTKEERSSTHTMILTKSLQKNKIEPGNVLNQKSRPMGKKHPNPASKLKQIIADKILNMPDDVFLNDMRFNKYFANKNLHKNLKKDQKYLRWALCRIYLDISFEEAEEWAKAEKKSAKRKNSK